MKKQELPLELPPDLHTTDITDPDTPQDLPSEAYTDDMIDELKALGLPKPPNLEWSRWVAPKDFNHRHDLIIQLAAIGRTNVEIAEEVGMAKESISRLIALPKFRDKIKAKQDQLFGKQLRKRIEIIASKAVDVVEEVLNNPQEAMKYRMDAAKYMLDQAVGKAQQQIEVKGNLLQEVLIHLEQQERSIDTTSRNLVDKPKDAMDDFIDTQLGEPIVVGKRNREQQEAKLDSTIGSDDTEQDY